MFGEDLGKPVVLFFDISSQSIIESNHYDIFCGYKRLRTYCHPIGQSPLRHWCPNYFSLESNTTKRHKPADSAVEPSPEFIERYTVRKPSARAPAVYYAGTLARTKQAV